jgi:hypothetical protein
MIDLNDVEDDSFVAIHAADFRWLDIDVPSPGPGRPSGS